ncbi:MAG: hypothetical protein OEM85_16880 [Gammaproteobacteria bacterium]|nr:hypothetical protein [Gammaproteobacteria bacterium]
MKKNWDGITVVPSEVGKKPGSCCDGASSYTLNATAISFEADTLTRENIDGLVGRLGVTLNWDDVARDTDLMKFIGETSVRRCQKQGLQQWKLLVTERNLISHAGGENLSFSVSELITKVSLIQFFAHALTGGISKVVVDKYG